MYMGKVSEDKTEEEMKKMHVKEFHIELNTKTGLEMLALNSGC